MAGGFTWPAELPQRPLQDGWRFSPRPNLDAFDPEVGLPIVERRSTAAGDNVPVAFIMTEEQLVDVFWPFYRGTLKNGLYPIDFMDPREGVRYDFMIDPTTTPEEQALSGNLYRITMQWIRNS